MSENQTEQIRELRNRIGEMQVALLATTAEVKALTVLSETLWEKQRVRMPDGKTFSELVRLLKSSLLDIRLSELADTDMIAASCLKTNVERYLEVENCKKPKAH